MNEITTADHRSKPANYEEFHRLYFSHIVYLCSIGGIDQQSVEDVASDIFMRLMERGFLDFFDADKVFEYQGEQRPARFKSFLSTTVTTYLRGHLDKQRRLQRREWQIVDLPVGTPTASLAGAADQQYWGTLYGPREDDHADEVIDMIAEEDTARGVRAYLATIPRRSTHDRCDLVALYDAVRAQILATGIYDVRLLREQFGIATTTMHTWMWWLKENLADAYGKPLPPKRARTTYPRTA